MLILAAELHKHEVLQM